MLNLRCAAGRRSSTEMPPPASWADKTTAIGSPETDKVAGIRPLLGPIVPLTPERIIESDKLLGASAHDVSFDGLAKRTCRPRMTDELKGRPLLLSSEH
jgi:hypothetical protein